MSLLTAFGAGVAAGLALAMPLGAIGVLLVREGTLRGWRRGAPAALAVATVDTLYCIAAVTLGAVLAPVIAAWAPWPRIVGGIVLLGIAAHGLLRLRRAPGAPPAGGPAGVPSWRRFVAFLALTAINPATLVYFAAVVTGMASLVSEPAAGALFVAGVALASLAWQLLLVLAGAALRWTTGPRTQRVTAWVGNGVVAILGILLIAGVIG